MPAVPPEIGPYRIVRPLGRGGMGAVYLAHDSRLDRHVALKLFSGDDASSDGARDQLVREARAAAAINHPHIASVHDILEVDGQVALVFEFVEGETLAERLRRGPLAPDEAIPLALQLCDALTAAHEHGVVHRDLKPANVAITPAGVVKVLDFGVARMMPRGADTAGRARTTASGFVGTVGYAAPEQCLGQSVDARADVFSFGVVLFEMLTGQRPFAGNDASSVVQSMLSGGAPRVRSQSPRVAPEIDGLVARMLARDPAERPASARQVRDVLRSLAPTERASASVPSRQRRAWGVAALLVAAVIVGALVATVVWGRASESPPDNRPPVLAVLPLTNASGEESKLYLATGVAENLVTRLASIPSITVLSRNVVNEARNRHAELLSLARELDATYLVDGSVQHVGERLRIDLRLLEPNGKVAWADDVEGNFAQVFELQSRLTAALAQALSVQLSAADRAMLAKQPTMNAQALEAYWRGRALLDRRDIKGHTDAALAAFDEAIRLDPNFAMAHAARGEALWMRYLDTRDAGAARDAIAAGTTALRLNPDSGQARYSLALVLSGTGRLDEAIDELQRTLALQPNHDDARAELGSVLARQGKIDEAIAEFQKAIALRPNFWGHYNQLGVSLLRAGRYAEAAEAFFRITELQPDNANAFVNHGAALQYLGRDEEAQASYRRALAIRPSPTAYANLGYIHHSRGEYAQAVEAYRASLQLRPNAAATHRNLGDALTRLGRPADAREAYREAVRLTEIDLSVNPTDARLIAALAVYATKAGDFPKGLSRAREAQQLAPDDIQVAFNLAAVYAMTNRRDDALRQLERAVAGGYSKAAIAVEDDFRNLRETLAFKELIAPRAGAGENR